MAQTPGSDVDDQAPRRMEAIAESTGAKFLARNVIPLMLTVLGFYIVVDRTESRQASERIEAAQQSQGADIATVKSDIRDLNTRFDVGVIRQVDSDSKRIDDHEVRLQRLERVVKTP